MKEIVPFSVATKRSSNAHLPPILPKNNAPRFANWAAKSVHMLTMNVPVRSNS